MTVTAADSRAFITRYLDALSGHPKPAELVAGFVSDAALAEHIAFVEAAFASYELVSEQMVVEGDVVAMRGTFRGRHSGTFAGIPATGRVVSAPLMIFYRLEDGRIAQHWLQFDGASLVAQLQGEVAAA
jgi:predicted ester cyclase